MRALAWHHIVAHHLAMIRNSDAPVAPLFTIAIPTFNRAGWLARSVGSALAQTFASFEVIVSDNASTDTTPAVLDRLSDERMTVLRQDHNVGPIANWNACLAAANGTYVIMLSDDDALAPQFLQRCASVIADDPNLPVVVGLGGVTDLQSNWQKPAVTSRSLNSGVCAGPDLLLEFLRSNISPQMCTVAMHTCDVRARGGFPDGWPHLGDLATWVPLLLYGKAGFVNESCGTYCSHDATQTTNLPVERRLEDFDKLGELIVNETRSRVADASIRKAIERLARRYVARNSVGHIASYRRSGASRRTVARMTWAHRGQLSALRTGDLRCDDQAVGVGLVPTSLGRSRGSHQATRAGCVISGVTGDTNGGAESKAGVPSMMLGVGEWVEVRSREEILATLDKNGRLEELPFMPQMFQYCGRRLQVIARAHKTCDVIAGEGRRLSEAIHLDTRCDGEAFGGCQASCLLFWKQAWVKKVSTDQNSVNAPVDQGSSEASGDPPRSLGVPKTTFGEQRARWITHRVRRFTSVKQLAFRTSRHRWRGGTSDSTSRTTPQGTFRLEDLPLAFYINPTTMAHKPGGIRSDVQVAGYTMSFSDFGEVLRSRTHPALCRRGHPRRRPSSTYKSANSCV